jgi:acyl carrier protein
MAPVTTPSDVERTIVATLATMASAPEPVGLDTLLCAIDVDSLDLVELAQVVEDECGLSLELGELRGLETVGAVVEVFGERAR